MKGLIVSMKLQNLLQTLAVAGLLLTPMTVRANLLAPGATVAPDALTVGPDIPPASPLNVTLLASTGVQTSNIGSSGVQANYIENVYRTNAPDPTNLACPLGGCLDFVIAVQNIGTDIIEHVTTSSFANVTTDVGVQIPQLGCAALGVNPTCVISDLGAIMTPFTPGVGGLQQVPDAVHRSGGVGSVISFDFTATSMNPGDVSDLLVIETNATAFGSGTLGFIDGSGASGTGFAPTPEPRLAGLAAMGLLGVVAFFVRRRKAQTAE